MCFRTYRIGVCVAAAAALVGSTGLFARPATASDSAITDAMLDVFSGSRSPSPVAVSIHSPLGPLIVAVTAARQVRIAWLKAQIDRLNDKIRLDRARISWLHRFRALEKAKSRGAPVSKTAGPALAREARDLGLGWSAIANPRSELWYYQRTVKSDQTKLETYEAQLNQLETPSAASNGSGNFTQSALSSLATSRTMLGNFPPNLTQAHGLSLNGAPVPVSGPSGELSELDTPVRILTGVTHVDYDQNSSVKRKGHVTTAWTGVHFALNDHQAAGLFGTYRGGEARLSTFTSSLDSDAFGIGGYFTSVIAGDLTGSLQFEYNRGHHDIVIGGATGNFSTDDIAVQGEIKGRYQIPNRATRPIDFLNLAWYEPMAALSFTHVSRESYTTNTGVTVASGNLDRARLTVGPRVGTTVLGDGENVNLIEPYFNLQGIWDFVNEGNFLVAAGTVVKTPDIGGLVGGGIEVSFMNNAAIKIESNYAFFEDDFDSWSISGTASMPLAALGILEEGSAGLVSLQFNALPASSSAMLQVNLPFN